MRVVLPGLKTSLRHQTALRHFHATQPQPWLVPVGFTCAGLFLGTRYILRAQERVRRRRAGLPGEGDEGEGTEEGSSPLSKMQQVLGVDVGSSNLRVATASLLDSAHGARVIESADGLRATPAAVAVDNGSVSIGAIAKALQGRKPGHTATATRLLLGPATKERDELINKLPYTVHQRGETLEIELDGKTYSPEWATEIMLDHLHSTAASSLGEDPIENFPAVLAVPAGTNEHERAAYEKVADSAGFTVFAAIDEPVAALHAAEECAIQELQDAEALLTKGPIAVLDIGGYVSTMSLLKKERRSGGFKLLHTLSTHAISGHQVNELLFRSVVEKFEQDHGIDLSVDYMASYRILEAVESAKVELSSRVSTDINLPFITADQKGAKHLVHRITSFDLARVQEGPAREAIALCNQVLNEASVSKEDLSAFVLIGGGAKSEFMREQLETFFKLSAFSTKNFRPEEAVALGAAEYGRKLVQEY
ncbi:Hsp70 protein [Phytophthora infestans]|uniref:Hsp70 protein n=1 Tax=Phytophthora infestans TaxID=4787 RepID=A0A8S9UMN5_PHYIN|nr:Hsp70 protein [Phytophthora infestans]